MKIEDRHKAFLKPYNELPKTIKIYNNETKEYESILLTKVEQLLKITYCDATVIDQTWLSFFPFDIASYLLTLNGPIEKYIGLRYQGPQLGWNAYALKAIPAHTTIGYYAGEFLNQEEFQNPYLIKSGKNQYVSASKICNLARYLPHLPSRDEFEKYNFGDFKWLSSLVAKKNIGNIARPTDSFSSDVILITMEAIKKGEIVGFSYNEKAHFQIMGTTPMLFDKEGNPIPRVFYQKKMYCHSPDKSSVRTFPSELIEIIINYYKHKELLRLEEVLRPLEYTLAMFKKILVQQQYIPSTPESYQHPNDLLLELRKASDVGDYNKVWYLLEWHEQRDELQKTLMQQGPQAIQLSIMQCIKGTIGWSCIC